MGIVTYARPIIVGYDVARHNKHILPSIPKTLTTHIIDRSATHSDSLTTQSDSLNTSRSALIRSLNNIPRLREILPAEFLNS